MARKHSTWQTVAVKPWILLAFVAACETGVARDVSDGPQLFASVCAACHGPGGKPDPSMVARLGVRDLTDPALRARVNVGMIEAQIRSGSKNKLMPSFAGALTDAQITVLAAYVASPEFLATR